MSKDICRINSNTYFKFRYQYLLHSFNCTLNLRNIQISHQIVHALFSDFRVCVSEIVTCIYYSSKRLTIVL